jgi:hypothetical protein
LLQRTGSAPVAEQGVRPDCSDDIIINNTSITNPMTTIPKRSNQINVAPKHRVAAFERENLRLQKKIAKLEAENTSLKHVIKIHQPAIRAALKQAATDAAAEKLAASLDAT